jgi:hypothetical protein
MFDYVAETTGLGNSGPPGVGSGRDLTESGGAETGGDARHIDQRRHRPADHILITDRERQQRLDI